MTTPRVVVVTDEQLRDLMREVIREELGQRDGYVTIREAAQVARVHPATIRDWIREGHLPRHAAGRRPRVLLSELRALLANPPGSKPKADLVAKVLAIHRKGGA